MEGLCLVHASLRVDRVHRVLWQYPAARAGMSLPFQLDGDVFFGPGYTSISSHQENQDTIQVLTFPGGKQAHRIARQYGRTDRAGTNPGYLHTPDGLDLLPAGPARRIPAIGAAIGRGLRTAAHR